jgi:hypothetical protein
MRQGIADALEPMGIQVSPYVLYNPTPPCAYVQDGPVNYDASMGRGHDDWTFTVFVLVGMVSDIGSQMKLDSLRKSHGDMSVKALIEADRTLGGACIQARVPDVSGSRIYTLEGPPVLGAEWTVLVMADGRG